MVVLSADLSYTRTGLCLLNTEEHTLTNLTIKTEPKDKSFRGTQSSIREILTQLRPLMERADHMVMEEPFPKSEYSSGLWALDTAVFQLASELPNIKTLVTYNPSTLGHIHGTRKYNKSDSTNLANRLREELLTNHTKNKKRITHDEAEATIYLCKRLSEMTTNAKYLETLNQINPRIAERSQKHGRQQ